MARSAESWDERSRRCVNNFALLSPQWTKRMATVHDEIDTWLAADLHGELSDKERDALHAHLIDCAACRRTHQEIKTMNKILEETLAQEKADPAFEQRMLAGFRSLAPQRSGLVKLLVDLMRLRATQFAAVAAVLLGLVQIGRMITGEPVTAPRERERYVGEQFAAQPSQVPAWRAGESGVLAKSEGVAAGRSRNLPVKEPPPPAPAESKDEVRASAEVERTIVTGSNIPTVTEEAAQASVQETAPALANRKLIRNATVELEIVGFDNAVQKITAFANEEHGYVATTDSEKQANGKLKGQIVVKVLPENLDRFLQRIRGLGELKNQTLGTEDVTKAYFDTDARLKNAHVMEQRLVDILKKQSKDVADLLAVEKELDRVREEIEQMQGDLKYWDSQVQFATVTMSLAEKDMEEPAAFLLRERAQLALYAPDVERIYNEIKSLASSRSRGMQITNAQLNRDYSGRVSAQVSMLIAPEESDGVIGRVKAFGRVENFQIQTQRTAQGGNPAAAGSENARTKRDKVQLNIAISREEQEQAFH